jgi:hypothetical protein
MPDATINTNGPIDVQIQARFVPTNTTVTLYIVSENAADKVLNSTPLAGSFTNSTTTVTVTNLPSGFSRGFVRANWMP